MSADAIVAAILYYYTIALHVRNSARLRHSYYGRLIGTHMRSIEWHYFQLPWVTHNYPKPPYFPHFLSFHILVASGRRDVKFGTWVDHSKCYPTDDKASQKGAWPRSCEPCKILVGTNHISGTAATTVVIFCTQVGYIRFQHLTSNLAHGLTLASASQRMTKHLDIALRRAWSRSRDPF